MSCTSKEFRLHVIDRKNGRRFLVDTGSAVSVIPHQEVKRKLATSTIRLYAANSTVIKTYGEELLTINLGLRREIKWPFIVADVKVAIIGADLISFYGFLVDLKQGKIIDPISNVSAAGNFQPAEHYGILTLDANAPCAPRYAQLLEKFVDLTKPSFCRRPLTETTVAHHIVTEGPPTAERPRKLSGEKLKAAQAKINALLEQGILRPSNSAWASPLHMAAKKTATGDRVARTTS